MDTDFRLGTEDSYEVRGLAIFFDSIFFLSGPAIFVRIFSGNMAEMIRINVDSYLVPGK